MSTKHTNPWRVLGYCDGSYPDLSIVSADGSLVAQVPDENIAFALCACPEMYEALERCRRLLATLIKTTPPNERVMRSETFDEMRATQRQVANALKKARNG